MEIGSREEKRLLKGLLELFGNTKGKDLLDYGCGRGKLVKLLLDPIPKSLLAVDIMPKAIEYVETTFKDAVTSKVLSTKLASSPKELLPDKFDGIFCVDVLECIDGKVEFIKDLYGLLKPKGSIILAHHDFDSIIYNSSNVNLTRDLIHNFADAKQEFQDNVDGQMGRKIPGILKKSNIKNFNFETIRMSETTFNQGDYGYLMAQLIKEVAKGKFDANILNGWMEDLQTKAKNNDYYFAIDFVVVKIELGLM